MSGVLLTDRQLETLRAVAKAISRGRPPTFRELCQKLGVRSTNTVAGHLAALERQQLITRDVGTARNVALTDEGRTVLGQLGGIG